MSVNSVNLLGNIGAQPEHKTLPSGNSVINFTVATTEKWSKDGKPESKTTWHKIVAFGKLADICNKFLSKGSQVYVQGKITNRDYENKDGQKVYVTEINASNVQFLGGNQDVNGAIKKMKDSDGDSYSSRNFASDSIPF